VVRVSYGVFRIAYFVFRIPFHGTITHYALRNTHYALRQNGGEPAALAATSIGTAKPMPMKTV
jgi:hypothetical protein